MPVGYIDLNDRWVIQPEYTEACGFRGGVAMVAVGDRGWALIDRTNHFVLPPQDPIFSSLHLTRCGTRAVFKLDGKYGVCDQHGNQIVPPKYDLAMPDYGQVRLLCCKLGEEEYHFIDFDGNVVIDKLAHANPFKSGCAKVRFAGESTSCLISPQGKVLFRGDANVSVMGDVRHNVFHARVKLEGGWNSCLMDLKGNIVFKSGDGQVVFTQGINQVTVSDRASGNRGVVDFAKNWIVPPKYEKVRLCGHTSMFLVARKSHTPEQEMMLLDPTGKPMFKRWYHKLAWARPFFRGSEVGFLRAINKDGLHGAIDYQENIVLKFKKRRISNFPFYFEEGLLPCEVD